MTARDTLIARLPATPPQLPPPKRNPFYWQFGKFAADFATLRLALQEKDPPLAPTTMWAYAQRISDDVTTLALYYEQHHQKSTQTTP